jgi:hypothetical protein
MSAVAAPVAAAATAALSVINPIEAFFNFLNTNPYFIGLMMIILNLGGRFLGMEISKGQEKFFSQVWVRRAIVFTVIFIATRNVIAAIFMTIIILMLMSFLFNETSSLYLGGKEDVPADGMPQAGLTPEETDILRRLMEKQARLAASGQSVKKEGDTDDPPFTSEQVYMQNMSILQTVR